MSDRSAPDFRRSPDNGRKCRLPADSCCDRRADSNMASPGLNGSAARKETHGVANTSSQYTAAAPNWPPRGDELLAVDSWLRGNEDSPAQLPAQLRS